jgi:hypothetical protein
VILVILHFVAVEHPSVLSTYLFADEVKLGIEIGNGICGWRKFVALSNFLLIILFLLKDFLILDFGAGIKWLLELNWDHDVGLLSFKDAVSRVWFSTLSLRLGNCNDGKSLFNKMAWLIRVRKSC